MQDNDLYYEKYLKYKTKYLNLESQIGGGILNVGTALFFNDTIYLVKENNGKWNLPGGGINDGENHYQASIREFKEETGGFCLDTFINQLHGNHRNHIIKELSYGRGHNKHTKFFLYYLKKAKPNIIFKKNNETIDGNWFNIDNLPNNIRFPKSMDDVIRKYLKDK
jgi:8-oxo-dGTP pyrophosphatase MutT (NUDIX family)